MRAMGWLSVLRHLLVNNDLIGRVLDRELLAGGAPRDDSAPATRVVREATQVNGRDAALHTIRLAGVGFCFPGGRPSSHELVGNRKITPLHGVCGDRRHLGVRHQPPLVWSPAT